MIVNAALVNDQNLVVYRIVIDDAAPPTPPSGQTLIVETAQTGASGKGWTWDGTKFVPPPENVAPPPTADELRIAGIKSDASYIDLFNRAKTATASEIDTWFTANVTNLAQARGVLSAIVKLLATRL